MSEELKPCPCCGCDDIAEGQDLDGQSAFTCEECGLGTAWDPTEVARAAWNRRASPTPEGGEEVIEAAKRIVAWDDDGRLADDEWLVERNDAAIIAIARALLSSPRVEEARRLREALAAAEKALARAGYDLATAQETMQAARDAKAARALSLQVEGTKP